MSAEEPRLLDPALLPESLWDARSKILRLPPILARAYQTIIDRHNLRELSASRDLKDSPVGGLTQELTDKHFAQAFGGSVARAQLALLDPKSEVNPTSDSFVRSLSGNRVSLTDAPCGAGAAAFSFLAAIHELRACGVLPRLPLDVSLIGAELSEPARTYFAEILGELGPTLEQQAIFVKTELLSWDVTNDLSNADLIRQMTLVSATHPKRLLVVANFNGFLVKEDKWDKAHPQLKALFLHASGPSSMAIWIEADMNRTTGSGGLFARLRRFFQSVCRLFAKERSDESAPIPTSFARFFNPLDPSEAPRVKLAVLPLELVRSR